MKIKYIIILALIGFSYSSCDKIDAPYREPVVVSDFCKTGIEDSVTHHKVLVEDYTGHFCGNCPDAGYFLNDTLKPLYQHCLISISIHAGFFAPPCPNAPCPGNQPFGSFLTDFRSAVGNQWDVDFHVEQVGAPIGMVDRIDYPTANLKTYTAWASAVSTELAKPAQASIKITNTYNSSTNSVGVSVKTVYLNDLAGDYKLQVVISEDSIVDWQEWYHPRPQVVFLSDYVFHDVLRDAVNTNYGEILTTTNAPSGTSITKNYSYSINNAWNVNHCHIVAFLYKVDTFEILQVEEQAVK